MEMCLCGQRACEGGDGLGGLADGEAEEEGAGEHGGRWVGGLVN